MNKTYERMAELMYEVTRKGLSNVTRKGVEPLVGLRSKLKADAADPSQHPEARRDAQGMADEIQRNLRSTGQRVAGLVPRLRRRELFQGMISSKVT